jgi:hypothetical protein
MVLEGRLEARPSIPSFLSDVTTTYCERSKKPSHNGQQNWDCRNWPASWFIEAACSCIITSADMVTSTSTITETSLFWPPGLVCITIDIKSWTLS